MTPIPTTVSYADQIADIMERFDFEKVARVMELMEWTWGDTYPHSPTVEQLEAHALDLFDGVREPNDGVSSGGLRASADAWNQLALDFVVVSADSSELCSYRDHS